MECDGKEVRLLSQSDSGPWVALLNGPNWMKYVVVFRLDGPEVYDGPYTDLEVAVRRYWYWREQ